MRKFISPLFLSILFIDLNAQNTSISDNSAISSPAHRNEIGLNITPLIKLLTAASVDNNRYSISYKRIVNEKWAFRTSIGIDVLNSYSLSQFNSSDTLVYKGYSSQTNSPFVRIGYERYIGHNKFKMFYGADALAGYYQNTTNEYNTKYINDGSILQTASTGSEKHSKENGIKTGVSPFFGFKYALSKKISFSVQTGADCYFSSGNSTTSINTTTKKMHSNSFGFSEEVGIINDCSIIYKF